MEKRQSISAGQTSTPLVSVVLCTYNGEKYLREQLESVVHQTYPLHEIIIQDDGSTDRTMQIAEEFAASFDNIVVKLNTHEHGVNGNFFSAMRSATGEFIAICDQDDVWEADKIRFQVEAIGDKLMCACHSKPFADDGSFAHYDQRIPNIGLNRLIFCNEIPGHTMLIHRRLLDLLPFGNCDAVFQNRMYDVILAITAAAYDSITYLNQVLVHQRRYQEATTYTDYSKSLPSFSNALSLIMWSMRYYHKMKTVSRDRFAAIKDFIEHLSPRTETCSEGIRFMELQVSRRFIDFIRLERMCVTHRSEIFHTRGKDPMNIIRAMLFPYTSLNYCSFLLHRSDK